VVPECLAGPGNVRALVAPSDTAGGEPRPAALGHGSVLPGGQGEGPPDANDRDRDPAPAPQLAGDRVDLNGSSEREVSVRREEIPDRGPKVPTGDLGLNHGQAPPGRWTHPQIGHSRRGSSSPRRTASRRRESSYARSNAREKAARGSGPSFGVTSPSPTAGASRTGTSARRTDRTGTRRTRDGRIVRRTRTAPRAEAYTRGARTRGPGGTSRVPPEDRRDRLTAGVPCVPRDLGVGRALVRAERPPLVKPTPADPTKPRTADERSLDRPGGQATTSTGTTRTPGFP